MSRFCTTSYGVSSNESLVQNLGHLEIAAWVRSGAKLQLVGGFFKIADWAWSTEAFVVCENFRSGFTSDLTKPLLDFSYAPASDRRAQTIDVQAGLDSEKNELLGQMRVIAPFVACGDLRWAAKHKLIRYHTHSC